MDATRQISISLPEDLADALRARVESGEYASESEVVCEGLLALRDRDQSVEEWLRNEVAATYDAMMADPGRGIPVEEVKAALAAQRSERG